MISQQIFAIKKSCDVRGKVQKMVKNVHKSGKYTKTEQKKWNKINTPPPPPNLSFWLV